MTDSTPQMPEPRPKNDWLEASQLNVQVIYGLYLASFLVGLTGLIGVVFAYVNRPRAGGWLATHYTWLIRTFWIGLLYAFVSMLLTFILVGFLMLVATAVWFIVRCIIGLQKASRGDPIANPQSWVF